MKKFYPYSVKALLKESYGEDTVFAMRSFDIEKRKGCLHDPEYAWKYADLFMLECFEEGAFLQETLLCDDYIAYIATDGTKNYVFLAFYYKNRDEFDLDPKYAYILCDEWRKKGYEPVISRICLGIENKSKDTYKYSFEHKNCALLVPEKAGGRFFFTHHRESYWDNMRALLLNAVTSGDLADYECVLKKDAEVSECDEEGVVLAKGIEGIKRYFDKRNAPFLAYIKEKDDLWYNMHLVSGRKYYDVYVDVSNQITRLAEKDITICCKVIPVPKDMLPKVIAVPPVTSLRVLNIEETRAYGIRVEYSDGCARNYYLHLFDTEEIPDKVKIDGFFFDKKTLSSVKYVNAGNVRGAVFCNGYIIPEHLLYYRGYTQLIPEKLNGAVFDNGSIRVEKVFRVPLKKRYAWNYPSLYKVRDDELYGAREALVDTNGNRISDHSGDISQNDPFRKNVSYSTEREADGKIGYLKKDGTWLVPPIFDTAEEPRENACSTATIGKKKYLVNILGEKTEFSYDINTSDFQYGLCPFSVKRHTGSYSPPLEDYFEGYYPGLWGYVDKYGKIAIEPQYVFATPFGLVENRAFVAKIVDGKTLWGLIDTNGNEVIPCTYRELSTHSGTAVNYMLEHGGDYGIMDIYGNVITEPKYFGIIEYDSAHGLLAVKDEDDLCGVVKVSDGSEVIPFEHEYIGFESGCIECETHCRLTRYTYEGELIGYDGYGDHIMEDGSVRTIRDEKYGVIDKNGNIKVPFEFDDTFDIDYYEKGFVVTGKSGAKGVSSKNGDVILPQRYTHVSISDGFIEATSHGGIQELYLADGTPVLSGLYRKIRVNGNIITADTPQGEVRFRIK